MKPPISDPFAPPISSQNHRVFRVDFWRCLVGCFLFCFFFFAPIMLPIFSAIRVNNGFFIFCGIVIFGASIGASFGWFYPVEINENELRGINFWGAKRKVEWLEIRHARFAWFIFPYAIISTSRKRNLIWLPLYLSDMKGFARAVQELAPANNPLRLYIEKRGF